MRNIYSDFFSHLISEIKDGRVNLSTRFVRLGGGNRTDNTSIKIETSYSLS